jgi:glycosyltransferase involved in cell wall biosynthesis
MPKFSLIIPVYNTEEFLAECLNSCINQTFSDIEIICINDSSTDNSRIILDEYASRDNRIRIITHEKNRKLGAARNTGVAASNGNYCWFIDSDDYILLNACEILNDTLEQFNADIIRFNRIDYYYDNNTGKKKLLPAKLYSWAPPNRMFTKKDYKKLYTPEASACMYITSTRLLRTVRFREGIEFEDADYTPILFSKSEKIYYLNFSLYCVRQRKGSISRNEEVIEGKHFNNILLAANSLYEYIISVQLKRNHFCIRAVVSLYWNACKNYIKFPELHTVELDNIIKKIKPFFIINSIHIIIYDNFFLLIKEMLVVKMLRKIIKFIQLK